MNEQKLLLEESFIAVNHRVARELGLEAAAVLQQLHFRLSLGRSDGDGRWIVATKRGRKWLSWSPEGRTSDLPLGRADRPGRESAFRRVIDQLVRHGLIDVEQVEKTRWNRSNFFAINYDSFNEKFQRIEPLISTERPAEVDGSNALSARSSKTPERPPLVAKEKNINEEREDRPVGTDGSDASLWMVLDRFVSRRTGDDPLRDRKKCALVERICSQNGIGLTELQDIAADPKVQFATQLQRRIEEIVGNRRARDALRVRTAAIQSAEAQKRASSDAESRRDLAALATLQALGNEALTALANKTAAAAPPSMRMRVVSHILKREIGAMPYRSFIANFIFRQAYTPPESELQASSPH